LNEPTAEWILGPRAQSFLDGADAEERLELIRAVASILLDPRTDGVTKFDLDYFPYAGLNLRQAVTERLVVIYRAYESGPFQVYSVFRRADLPRPSQGQSP